MEIKRLPERKINIRMHNALVNAAQGLTLSEKRIVMMAITKIPKIINQTSIEPIKLDADEFSDLYQIQANTAYEQIQNACESLIKKQVRWLENGTFGIEKIILNWVSSARYAKGKGNIEISFTTEIQKFLLELKTHFTTYQLQQARTFKSIYSWRLLEILSQFKKTGWRTITLEDFSKIMEATEKQKKDFCNIRRGIIEPAVKEINQKANWKLNWKTIKIGNKVNSIHFEFKKIK